MRQKRRRVPLMIAAGVLWSFFRLSAVEYDQTIGVRWWAPDSEVLDAGALLNLQSRWWFTPHIGMEMSLGVGRWPVTHDTVVVRQERTWGPFRVYYDTQVTLESGLDGMPIGLSLVLSPRRGDTVELTLKGGATFLPFGIKMRARDAYLDIPHRSVDYAVVGDIGVELAFELNEQVSLFAGAGHMFSIEKPVIEYRGHPIAQLDLGGFHVQAGLRF